MRQASMAKAATYGEWLKSMDDRGLGESMCRTYDGASREECVKALPVLMKQLKVEDAAPGPYEGMIIQMGENKWLALAYSTVAIN